MNIREKTSLRLFYVHHPYQFCSAADQNEIFEISVPMWNDDFRQQVSNSKEVINSVTYTFVTTWTSSSDVELMSEFSAFKLINMLTDVWNILVYSM